jgi:hypothetical protein
MQNTRQKFLPYFTEYLEFFYGISNVFMHSMISCRSPNDVVRNPGWEKLIYTAPLSCFLDYNENVLKPCKLHWWYLRHTWNTTKAVSYCTQVCKLQFSTTAPTSLQQHNYCMYLNFSAWKLVVTNFSPFKTEEPYRQSEHEYNPLPQTWQKDYF